MTDYYNLLGLSPNATLDEIKLVFRKLSVKFHPDTNNGDPFFKNMHEHIREAYTVLEDLESRKAYDIQLNSALTPNAGTNTPLESKIEKSNSTDKSINNPTQKTEGVELNTTPYDETFIQIEPIEVNTISSNTSKKKKTPKQKAIPQKKEIKERFWSNQGRLSKKIYVLSFALLMLPIVIFSFIIDDIDNSSFFSLLVLFTTITASIQIIKRLHDLNYNGWLCLLIFVPFLNFAFLAYLLLANGTNDPNKYGNQQQHLNSIQQMMTIKSLQNNILILASLIIKLF